MDLKGEKPGGVGKKKEEEGAAYRTNGKPNLPKPL